MISGYDRDRAGTPEAPVGPRVRLYELAKDLGLSLPVFAIAWCLKNPNVSTVILGASKVAQFTENLQALEAQARFTPEILKRIDGIVAV